MKVPLRTLGQILKETVLEWYEDDAMRHAAALAYYSMFSLAPILLLAVRLAGLLYDRAQAQQVLTEQLGHLIGPEGTKGIMEMLDSAARSEAGALATALGIFTLLFGATGVVVALKASMNAVWGVVANPDRPWLGVILDRLLSLGLVLGVGFLLLVSLVLSTLLAALTTWAAGLMPIPVPLAYFTDLTISFIVITLLFAMIFRLLPDVYIAWGDVWLGAAFTTVLFMIGRVLIGMYLGNASLGTYGAIGSLAVVLIWVYYSSLILFLGAEFTQVYSRTTGARFRPSRGAIRLTEAMQQQITLSRKQQRQEEAADHAEHPDEVRHDHSEAQRDYDLSHPSSGEDATTRHKRLPGHDRKPLPELPTPTPPRRWPYVTAGVALGWLFGKRRRDE